MGPFPLFWLWVRPYPPVLLKDPPGDRANCHEPRLQSSTSGCFSHQSGIFVGNSWDNVCLGPKFEKLFVTDLKLETCHVAVWGHATWYHSHGLLGFRWTNGCSDWTETRKLCCKINLESDVFKFALWKLSQIFSHRRCYLSTPWWRMSSRWGGQQGISILLRSCILTWVSGGSNVILCFRPKDALNCS